jgi:CubicO group peptidase (beta-lactamase class C family)
LQGLEGFVEQVRTDWKVPGIAVAIVEDGKIVHAKDYGQRDVKRGQPVTPDTLFAIGSCSKAFTAAALGILADDKTLEWDKPRRMYLPDLEGGKVTFLMNKAGEIDCVSVSLEPNVKEIVFTRKKETHPAVTSN